MIAPERVVRYADDYKKSYLGESEVVMAEFLADEPVRPEMTMEDAFLTYCALLGWSDGDRFYVRKGGEGKMTEV